MVRAPCCEKMGLKKGPWAPEEDQILISYIQAHGHSNWRALPKQAGLLRCGKSCRLRWTNYLRPDVKRGDFTAEEEDTIFKLHEMLGNRWSAIAARLPGRTDNEIKNVWHTHLKKRLPQNHHTKRNPKQIHSSKCKQHPVITSSIDHVTKVETSEYCSPLSPPQCSSDNTSILTTSDINYDNQHINSVTTNGMSRNNVGTPTEDNIEALDEDFWSDVLSADDSGDTSNEIPDLGASADQHIQFPYSPLIGTLSVCDGFGMDFWYDVYTRAEGLTQLPEL